MCRIRTAVRVAFTRLIPSLALLAIAVGCGKGENAAAGGPPSGPPGAAPQGDYVLARVHRETIAIRVNSSGTMEPLRTVEIKSKASGKILRLPVEVGDVVEAGALLAQVDTTDVAAALRQKEADLASFRAQFAVAEGRKRRSDDLFRQGMISSDEHDEATLDFARTRAALVNADEAHEQAMERVRETIVRAPMRGTVIEKSVEQGQIIASATGQVTGGTTLMKMADLSTMQVRVLVEETDVGRIRPGQRATITAGSYPDRRFEGVILKVEPKAKKDRGEIIFFPALVRIDNREGLLLPDMTCTVEIDVVRKDNALVVATEALVRPQEARSVATLLGIDSTLVDSALAKVGAKAGSGPDLSQMPQWMLRGMAAQLRAASGSMGMQDVGIAFLRDSTAGVIRPVAVRAGVKDWALTEVAAGLDEGADVVVPPSLAVARQFKEFHAWLARMGGGLPGRK